MNDAPSILRVALEIAGYQVAWWSCVLSVRADSMWIGLLVTCVVFAIHLACSSHWRYELWAVPVAAGMGFLSDNAATLLGAIQFESATIPLFPAPLWIASMWLAFAMLIVPCFAWLADRPLAAALMGATSGPTAYGAGVALEIVTMPHLLWSVIVLAVVWAIIVPVVIKFVMSCTLRSPTGGAHITIQAKGFCE